MAVSYADFAGKIAASAPVSGNAYRTINNPDGTLSVLRSLAASPGTWAVYHQRVLYQAVEDKVFVMNDGSTVAVESSAAYVAGLN